MNTFIARIARPFAAVLLVLAAQSAMAVDLVEGVHYKALRPAVPTNVAPGKIEVVEVFWYACGHCYLLEPKLDAWERNGKAANVELVRMPAVWNDVLKTHARLFYTIEALGKRELHGEAFREINVRGNRLDTPDKIEAFFTSRGVSKADLQKAGFAVNTNFSRAVDLNKRYRITSTPTVIVNGKYVTDASMAGGEDKLFQVINALAAREKPAT
ncbi:MAG: thiol:disulfide interchange protein DsbA/DsbL [Steroidobacteraceae bacterium]|nr:thiol:disulfide interchange protein DsbA/DsbL [Steroidobacteraceae bacterium]